MLASIGVEGCLWAGQCVGKMIKVCWLWASPSFLFVLPVISFHEYVFFLYLSGHFSNLFIAYFLTVTIILDSAPDFKKKNLVNQI